MNKTYKIISEFLANPENIDTLWESDAVIWIDWREYDEDIVKYFNQAIENKISVQLENNGKEYGDDIILNYKEKTVKIPYQEKMERDITIKWVNEIIKEDFSIRLFTESIGNDTLGFIILKNEEWSILEKSVGTEELEHYFLPINLESAIFDMEMDFDLEDLEIDEESEDLAFHLFKK